MVFELQAVGIKHTPIGPDIAARHALEQTGWHIGSRSTTRVLPQSAVFSWGMYRFKPVYSNFFKPFVSASIACVKYMNACVK